MIPSSAAAAWEPSGLARDTRLGRNVAVKQVISTADLDHAEAEEIRRRALREGRVAAQLTHEHAISMYDVALHYGEPWLVMEHLPSRSLAQVMNAVDTLPPYIVAQIGANVATLSPPHMQPASFTATSNPATS